MVAKEAEKRNRIRINFATCEIEVESCTDSLDKVFAIADVIARNIGRGSIDGKPLEERLSKAGIR